MVPPDPFTTETDTFCATGTGAGFGGETLGRAGGSAGDSSGGLRSSTLGASAAPCFTVDAGMVTGSGCARDIRPDDGVAGAFS
jgi:hypothetical protein